MPKWLHVALVTLLILALILIVLPAVFALVVVTYGVALIPLALIAVPITRRIRKYFYFRSERFQALRKRECRSVIPGHGASLRG